jgi:hypothetical protein
MANAAYLASTLMMGLLGVGVVVLVLRGRRWENYRPQAAYGLSAGGGAPRSALSKFAGATSTWTVGFFLLALGLLGAVVVASSGAVGGTIVIAGLAVAVVAFLVGGVYVALRGNGRSSSVAAAGSAMTLGFLIIAIIALNLILGL